MKIEDVVKQYPQKSLIKDFLDADQSGEVYSSAELAAKLNLETNYLHGTHVTAEYRYVMKGTTGQGKAWWGNPRAVAKLKSEVEKYVKA